MALGASICYNYYLNTLRLRERKKAKKLDKDNRVLQYNLQRVQQQMEVCMTEKRNTRISVNTDTPVIQPDPRPSRQEVIRPKRTNTTRYISPAIGTASIVKRGVN